MCRVLRTGNPAREALEMQPEKGDPSVQVTRSDVADGLRSVGVEPGDTAFFHSSLFCCSA